MKFYYYVKDSQRKGPFTFDQLRNENITLDTLVWCEGLPSWQFAKDLPELGEIFNPIIEDKVEENTPLPHPVEMDKHTVTDVFVSNPNTQNNSFDDDSSKQLKKGMFANPFGFRGRIRRLEYCLSYIVGYIFNNIISVLALDASESGEVLISIVLFIVLLFGIWFLIAQGVKRCHDRGNSGWFQLIPFYSLWMAFAAGDNFDNEYGPNPKG